MTRLLIIRHGNTFDAHETPTRVGARTDLSLSQSGQDQARVLNEYVKNKNFKIDYLYASALKRAQETAIGLETGLDVQTDTRFNEIDHGPDENKPEDEVIARIGKDALDDWNERDIVPDGWVVEPEAIRQNWIDFAEDCVKNRTGQTSAVVSSGGIIKFAPVLIGGDLPDNQPRKVKTASLSLFEHDGEQWQCVFWNKRA